MEEFYTGEYRLWEELSPCSAGWSGISGINHCLAPAKSMENFGQPAILGMVHSVHGTSQARDGGLRDIWKIFAPLFILHPSTESKWLRKMCRFLQALLISLFFLLHPKRMSDTLSMRP